MKLSMLYIAPIFAVVILLAGCGLVTFVDVKGYDGPTLTIEKLAVIDPSPWGCIGCLRRLIRIEDDRREQIYPLEESVWKEYIREKKRPGLIKLLPGEYVIEGKYRGTKATTAYLSAAVTLKAGHRYSFHEEWCSGLISLYDCKGYTSNLYFQDDTTGEVIAGKKWSTYLQKWSKNLE